MAYEDVDRAYLSNEFGGAGTTGGNVPTSTTSAAGLAAGGFARSVSFGNLAEGGSGKHNATSAIAGDGDTVVTEQSEVGMQANSEYRVSIMILCCILLN